jgi:hypothetical protein
LQARIFVSPFEQNDLRPAIPPKRKKRPAEPSVDVEPVSPYVVRSFDSTVTSGWEPKRRDPGESPLASMTMPAEDEIDVMVLFQLLKDVRGMGQE